MVGIQKTLVIVAFGMNPLVVIVDGNSQSFLGVLLPHTIFIENGFEFLRAKQIKLLGTRLASGLKFLVQNALTNQHAGIADVYLRTCNQLADL